MRTLYTVGCSHTRYVWPTYADILARSEDFDGGIQNWAQSGFGNFAIFNRVLEIVDDMQPQDELIIQWTYPTRFDFHRHGEGWYQGGNLANLHDGVQKVIAAVAYDEDSYRWHTENYIKVLTTYLDTRYVNYTMLSAEDQIKNNKPLSIMDDYDIEKRKFLYVLPTEKIPTKKFDTHWTPRHHLKYLEDIGCKITDSMLTYVNKAEEILDTIDDWRMIHHTMLEEKLIESRDYGR